MVSSMGSSATSTCSSRERHLASRPGASHVSSRRPAFFHRPWRRSGVGAARSDIGRAALRRPRVLELGPGALVALHGRRRATPLVGQRGRAIAIERVEPVRSRHGLQRGVARGGGAGFANGLGGSGDRPASARCRRSTVAARGSASRDAWSEGASCSSASTSSSPSHSLRIASSAIRSFPSCAHHCSRRFGGVRPQPCHSSEYCRWISRIAPGSSRRRASVSAAAIAEFTDCPRPTIWLKRSRQ